jgi:CPA2 family monovalent cation:H+ antiporter-2
MSSTAVVLGLLNQRREIHRVHGRLCVGIALTQDMLTIPVLALLPALAVWAKQGRPAPAHLSAAADGLGPTLELLRNGAMKIAAICGIILFGRWVLPRFLREASKNSNTEALLIVATTAALGAAVATYQLGIGSALGAFLAGFMLSSTPFRHQLAGQLSPMRDLFMAVFFTAVGINMNVPIALESWWIVAVGVSAVLGLKALVIGGVTWGGGATASVAALTGLLLCQAGEFSLVVLGEASRLQLIDERTMSILIAIVVLSLIVTTPLYELGRKLEPRLVRVPLARWITNPALHEPAGAAAGSAHAHGRAADDPFKDDPLPYPHRPVIIAGFGVVGRNLAEHFAAAGIPFVVVELNPTTVIKQQKLGRSFHFGDISNPDVLESAGVRSAEAVILTIPDDEAVLRACRTIRSLAPNVFIAARTTYLSRAIAATEMGADYVCVEEVVTAQDMAKQVMERLARRAVGV